MSVRGVGGVFIKAKNPQKLYEWYESKLGLTRAEQEGAFVVPTETLLPTYQTVRISPADTEGFSPSGNPALISFQVDHLEPLLGHLATLGVPVEGRVTETEHGTFAWIHDPEGNRLELWEPPPYSQTLINLPEPE